MTPWVTRLLFANVLVFLVTMSSPAAFGLLELIPALAFARPWTPVTYMFVHAGLGHIFFNMLGLFFFGPRVEERLGGPHFIALYLVSGLGGAVLSVFTPNAAIVGASGAVFGVFLAFARFWPHHRVLIWGVIPVEARVLVLVATAYAVFSGVTGSGQGVAHFAHLGGYAGAYVYLRFLERNSAAARFRQRVEAATYGGTTPLFGSGELRIEAIPRAGLHEMNLEELDRLAAKVSAGGAQSLTPDERAFLHRMASR